VPPEPHPRLLLQRVRHSINTFRDNRRDALVRARNHFLMAVVVTTGALYLVFALVIVGWEQQAQLQTALAIFLVGGLVGLFNRLQISADTEQDVEDFGFSALRLLNTPIFSGLASIIGVALVSTLPVAATRLTSTPGAPAAPPAITAAAALPAPPAPATAGGEATSVAAIPPLGGSVTPTPTGTVGGGAPQALPEYPRLVDVFNLEQNRLALVLAAVFGLAPTVVIDRLRQQAKQYTDDLRSTQAPERAIPGP
jgi:hypothetical protein